MIYQAVRELLFRIDPEAAHDFAVSHIERLQRIPIVLQAVAAACRPPASIRTSLFGLEFASPVGIAAGFDKNALMLPMLTALGFGFLEVGTVTLHPQPGNPRPRMFRYPHSKALINRMGFNNDGATAVGERLHRWRESSGSQPPLFINVGKNREVPLDAAPAAYAECYRKLAPMADGCVLNLSSPNTPSLRDLQRPEHLETLLGAVRSVREGLQPLLIKIAPDVDDALLAEICEVCARLADGMVCTNTTTARLPGMNETGGLSGAPLMARSTGVLQRVRELVGPAYPLIGVGGIVEASDARRKLAAGANLVQVYTGFIYEGPGFARKLARALGRDADEK
ncbi:MAG: dihydroorotate dehydrogenase [Acidobacteria bacterium]|nr:dihydroorotate dehydrogenase [Acidobacteriota bacterium]